MGVHANTSKRTKKNPNEQTTNEDDDEDASEKWRTYKVVLGRRTFQQRTYERREEQKTNNIVIAESHACKESKWREERRAST